jgi:hypothetical protein
MESCSYSSLKRIDLLICFMKYILLLFIPVVLSACSEITDDVGDCVLDNNAEFQTDSLPTAIVNEEYSTNIVAGVTDTDEEAWYECAYEYEFTLEEGSLPDGLKLVNPKTDTAYDKSWRVAKIEGTPTKAGEYKFKLEVYLDAVAYDCDDLCDPSATKKYIITVKSE